MMEDVEVRIDSTADGARVHFRPDCADARGDWNIWESQELLSGVYGIASVFIRNRYTLFCHKGELFEPEFVCKAIHRALGLPITRSREGGLEIWKYGYMIKWRF